MRSGVARADRGSSVVGVVTMFTLGLALTGPAAAEIYKCTDDSGHSHYVDGIDGVPEPYRARAGAVGLRNAPASSTITQPALPQAPSGGTTIRYTPGERIMVDARVNGTHSVRLLLDTGADKTLIAPRALVAAGVSLARASIKGSIVGVTGNVDVQGVKIDSLEVGEARVGPLLVVSYDMNQPGSDGLLGRDFLERFNVAIDSSRGVVTVSPKR
jgi:Aspartyl protease/Domain of unknown function (DUF4124)